MMTRNIRKVISIICAVALVLSLGVVALTGTTSAFKLGDTPTGSALYLDFENKTGLADYNGPQSGFVADPENPENTVFKIVTGIGGDSYNFIPGKSADTVADFDTAKDGFELQPATTYTITFKLKLGAGSNVAHVNRFYCQNSDKSGKTGQHQFYTPTIDATNGTLEGSYYCLNEDTAWETVEYTFTTPAAFDIRDGAPNNHLALVCNNGEVKYANTYYFDDFTIDVVDEAKYEFDGEKGSTGTFWAPNNNELLADTDNAGARSYVDAAGYHIIPIVSPGAGYSELATAGKTAWSKVMALRDPDVNNGYAVPMKAGHKYLLSVKYKIANIDEANKIRLAVGYKTGGAGHYVIAPIGEYNAKTDWLYFDTIIDGSTAPIGKTAYAGQEILILMANQKATPGVCETLIESISLYEFKSDSDKAIVKYNSNGGNSVPTEVVTAGTVINPPIPTNADTNKVFAGWYLDAELKNAVPANYAPEADVTLYAKWASEYVNITFVCNGKETTTRLGNGTVLPRPERPNPKTFFLGWCTDKALTNVVTNAPGQDCTLYAKFDYMYTEFNQGGYSDKTGEDFKIVTDPTDPTNKVMQLKQSANVGSLNFEISIGDIAGAPAYELELNTKYMISFKYMIPATKDGLMLDLFTGAKAEYTGAGTKVHLGKSLQFAEGGLEDGCEWKTATFTFTTGSSFYKERVEWIKQNRLYFVLTGVKNGSQKAPALMYIDDLIVGPVDAKAPEGATTIKFNTNSSEIAPMFGYPGEAILMPDDPTMSSYKFLGWYTDKNFNNKFTATTYSDEDVELFAKWQKVADWKMDFDSHDYNTGGMSGRYTLKKENGNRYLHYRYEDAATSLVAPSISPADAYGRTTFNLGSNEPYIINPAVTYVVTFKYKVVEVTGANPKIRGLTSAKLSTWVDGVEQSGPVDLGGASTEWKTGTFSVKPNPKPATANFFGFAVNGDATILFDDFVITPDIDFTNIYGTTVISFNTNGGSKIDAIGGNPGETIYMPTKKPTRSGYIFKGWYVDSTLSTKFTDTVFGDESMQLVAGWALGRLNEGFEDLPISIQTQGISGAYVYYKNGVAGYDPANVKDGTSSIYRKADVAGSKAFTLCRDASMTLDVGSQYTLTMYVKPTNVGDAAGTINLVSMSTNTSISVPDATDVITTVGELKAGEWQKVTYTFTAKEQFIGISSSEGNDLYFDAVNINVVGYTGSDTGDTSVSPIIIAMMVLLAAGALLVTGKKVFSK